MFQIVRYHPTYCPITDALMGSTAERLPMTYFNRRLAAKLAGRMEAVAYDACSDASFRVIGVNESAYSRDFSAGAFAAVVADTGEFPF